MDYAKIRKTRKVERYKKNKTRQRGGLNLNTNTVSNTGKRIGRNVLNNTITGLKETGHILSFDAFRDDKPVLEGEELTNEVKYMLQPEIMAKWDEFYYDNFKWGNLVKTAYKVGRKGALRTSFKDAVNTSIMQLKKEMLEHLITGEMEIRGVKEQVTIAGNIYPNKLYEDTPRKITYQDRARIIEEINKGPDGFFSDEIMNQPFTTKIAEKKMTLGKNFWKKAADRNTISESIEKKTADKEMSVGEQIGKPFAVGFLLKYKGVPTHKFIQELRNAGKMFTIKNVIIPVLGNYDTSQKDPMKNNQGYDYATVNLSKIQEDKFNTRVNGKLPVLELDGGDRLDLPKLVTFIRKDCPREESNDPDVIIVNDAKRCHFFSTWE